MAKGRIADLHAALTWDLSDFERGTARIELSFNALLDKARDLANSFRNIGRNMTLGLTVPIAGLATTIGAMARTSAEDLKTIGNAARLAGEDIERIQGQANAAREFGIEIEKLGDIFKDTREKIGDFAATGGGEMADFFENIAPRVGLTAEAFRNLSGKDGLQLYYDSLVQAGASQEEIVFYMESIADEASALIPLLEKNGKLFDEYANRGPIFTPEQIKALERYRHALEDIGFAFDKIVIAAVNSGLIDMFTDIAEAVADWITRVSETNPGLLRFAGGLAVVVAAMGPLIMVLQALAVVVLPLFLARLGPVFLALSAIINPIGTLVVFLAKLSGGFTALIGAGGGVFSMLGRLALMVARLNPITAALTTVFLLFGKDVAEALGNLWERAKEVLGPSLEALFEAVSRAVMALKEAFTSLAESPLGQFLGLIIEKLGDLVGALVELAGGAVIGAIQFVIGLITAVAEAVAGAVRVVTLLLQGDWAGAWESAKNTVANMIAAMLPSFQTLFDWIHDALALLGILEERQKTATNVEVAEIESPEAPDTGGFLGGLPEPPKPPAAGRSSRTSAGPSEEDLEERREALKLEQELAVARERSDFDAIRALERRRDLQRLIAQYEDAGLKTADAKARAEADLAELADARRKALQEELKDDVLRDQLREARVRGDAFAIRTIERQQELTEGILELRRKGVAQAEAEEIVQLRLLRLDEARADAMAERAADEELARQIELGQIRGDDTRALEDEARLRDRVRELQRDQELSLQEATRVALAEASDLSRAEMQGNFRDAFRGGLQAAMNGDLKGFFQNWMEDASFNALSRVLDRIADRLGDLLSGASNGGGGLFGAIGKLFGGGGASSILPTGGLLGGGDGPVFDFKIPGFANGGSGKLGGLAGIDRNILSLNGRPIAKTSAGEDLTITPANDRGGGGDTYLIVDARESHDPAAVEAAVERGIAKAAPTLVGTSVQKTIQTLGRRRLPGGPLR
ncbi:MAG: hypothetical protein AAFP79_04955 [Pseudomonadota bacterium]